MKSTTKGCDDAGAKLEQLRREDLRSLDTVAAVSALSDAFDFAVANEPARLSSGMVEQQRLFATLRR